MMTHKLNEFAHNGEIMTHQLNEFAHHGEIKILSFFLFLNIISHIMSTLMNTHKLINYYE